MRYFFITWVAEKDGVDVFGNISIKCEYFFNLKVTKSQIIEFHKVTNPVVLNYKEMKEQEYESLIYDYEQIKISGNTLHGYS